MARRGVGRARPSELEQAIGEERTAALIIDPFKGRVTKGEQAEARTVEEATERVRVEGTQAHRGTATRRRATRADPAGNWNPLLFDCAKPVREFKSRSPGRDDEQQDQK